MLINIVSQMQLTSCASFTMTLMKWSSNLPIPPCAMSRPHAHWTMPKYVRGFAHPHRGNTIFWGHFGTERWVPFLHLHLGTISYRSPKRNCRGVSMGVDLGLAFCPCAMSLDTSGHRAPGRRISLGSSPWFPGVSLPSCAKPNKLLNNH